MGKVERERREEVSSRRTTLAQVARAVATSLDPVSVAQAACDALRSACGAQFVGVRTATDAGLRALAASVAPEDEAHRQRWLRDYAIYTSTPEQAHPFTGVETWREPRYLEDYAASSPEQGERLGLPIEMGLRGHALLPLRAGDRFEGTVGLGWRAPLSQTRFDPETLELAGQYLAVALAHARQHAAAESRVAQLRAVFEAVPWSVTLWDADGRLVDCSTHVKRVLDLPDDAPLSEVQARMEAFRIRSGRGSVPAVHALLARALQGKTSQSGHTELLAPSRRPVWVQTAAAPVRDREGRITGAVIAASNVTDLQRGIERSRSEAARAAVVTRVAREVAASLDPKRIAQAACDALREELGARLTLARIAETGGLRLLAYAVDPGDAEVLTAFATHHEWLPENADFIVAGASTWSAPRRHEDLTRLPQAKAPPEPTAVQAGLRGAVTLPLWAGDRFQGTLGVAWDQPLQPAGVDMATLELAGQYVATALANAHLHTAAERQRARLEAVLTSMGEAVVVVDREGRLVYANAVAERITPDVLDPVRPVHEQLAAHGLRDPSGQPIAAEDTPLARALRGEAVTARLQMRRPDGRDAMIESTTTPIHAPDGTIDGAVTIFRDVTAAEELDRLKDQFLATIAHDVRSPLSTIKGYAQGIARRAQRNGDASLGKMGHAIDAQVDAIDRLLSDLLDVRRIDQGRLELTRHRVDLTAFVRDTLDAMRRDPRFAGRELVAQIPEHPLIGSYDAGLLRRVFENLLSNAVKYSPADRPVRVTLAEVGSEARLEVRDEGIGISPADLPHIFEQFFRAANARERSRGQGLGLFVARSMIESHGGRIEVESKLGKGSSFIVTLPLGQDRDELTTAEATAN